MTGRRMRLVSWRVQPVVMIDDGEHLVAVQTQMVEIPAADWQAFKNGDDEVALEGLRSSIERAGEA